MSVQFSQIKKDCETPNPCAHHTQRKKWTNMNDNEKNEFLKWSNYSINSESQSNGTHQVVDQNGHSLSKKGLQRAIRRWIAAKNRPFLKKAKKLSKLSRLEKNSKVTWRYFSYFH